MAETHNSNDDVWMNKKHLSVILVTALLTLLSSGCRTMEGAGEDIEEAGQEIQESAQ